MKASTIGAARETGALGELMAAFGLVLGAAVPAPANAAGSTAVHTPILTHSQDIQSRTRHLELKGRDQLYLQDYS